MVYSSLSIITRALLTFFMSFGIVLCCGNKFIKYLSKHQSGGQPIREDGPQSHLDMKKGTPTMGGIFIILSVLFACLLFGNLNDKYPFLEGLKFMSVSSSRPRSIKSSMEINIGLLAKAEGD